MTRREPCMRLRMWLRGYRAGRYCGAHPRRAWGCAAWWAGGRAAPDSTATRRKARHMSGDVRVSPGEQGLVRAGMKDVTVLSVEPAGEAVAQIDHVVDYVLGEGLGADTTNEGLIDLEVVHMELLQIDQAGVAGAEIIHGQLDPHLVQRLEQREGMGIRHQQLPLGQLQHQRHLARCEAGEEAASAAEAAVVERTEE